MTRSIAVGVIIASVLIAPIAHADTGVTPIGDPFSDTLHLWTGIISSFEAATYSAIAAIDNSRSQAVANLQNLHNPKQVTAALAASVALAVSSTSTATTSSQGAAPVSTTTPPTQSRSSPAASSQTSSETSHAPASAFITQDEFTQGLAALSSSLQQLIHAQAYTNRASRRACER